jgi:hypothetical protein
VALPVSAAAGTLDQQQTGIFDGNGPILGPLSEFGASSWAKSFTASLSWAGSCIGRAWAR